MTRQTYLDLRTRQALQARPMRLRLLVGGPVSEDCSWSFSNCFFDDMESENEMERCGDSSCTKKGTQFGRVSNRMGNWERGEVGSEDAGEVGGSYSQGIVHEEVLARACSLSSRLGSLV